MLLLAVGQPNQHGGHGCRFDKDCLACRWAADAVADNTAPLALPRPGDPVALVPVGLPARPADRAPAAFSSRGPPLA
jgi:hypothetical protein